MFLRKSGCRLIRCLVVIGIAVAPLTHADEPIADLSSLLAHMRTATGQFEQSLRDADGKLLQASQGRFSVKKPGKFLWDTQSPFPQLLVSDGSQLWLYDPDLEQASVGKLDAAAGQTPALLLSGDAARIGESFDVTRAGDGNNPLQVFDLTAKDSQASFDHISATFDGGVLVRMSFKDKLNNQTLFVFEQVVLNGDLSDTLFSFTPPDGTDVIHND